MFVILGICLSWEAGPAFHVAPLKLRMPQPLRVSKAGEFDCILRDDFSSHLVLDTFEIPALRTPQRACPERSRRDGAPSFFGTTRCEKAGPASRFVREGGDFDSLSLLSKVEAGILTSFPSLHKVKVPALSRTTRETSDEAPFVLSEQSQR